MLRTAKAGTKSFLEDFLAGTHTRLQEFLPNDWNETCCPRCTKRTQNFHSEGWFQCCRLEFLHPGGNNVSSGKEQHRNIKVFENGVRSEISMPGNRFSHQATAESDDWLTQRAFRQFMTLRMRFEEIFNQVSFYGFRDRSFPCRMLRRS